jgi:hypothetical protein
MGGPDGGRYTCQLASGQSFRLKHTNLRLLRGTNIVAGADPADKDALERQLLLHIITGNIKGVQQALEAGAPATGAIKVAGNDAQEPMHMASSKGSLEIVKLLRSYGGEP